MYILVDWDAEAFLEKIRHLSRLISQCFARSLRKDWLIQVVRKSIDTGAWDPCLQDLDNWSDWERFAALELLVSSVGLGREDVLQSFLLQNFTAKTLILQGEILSQATQDSDFVVQLRTICDSVLYAYLSKVADTAEKRHYLYLSCTVVDGGRLHSVDLDGFLNDLHKLEILDLQLSIFQPHDPRVLLFAMNHLHPLSNYFKNFISNPERSRDFHYEDSSWHALVATRYMRFLRSPSYSR